MRKPCATIRGIQASGIWSPLRKTVGTRCMCPESGPAPLPETDGNVWFRKLVSIPRSMAGKSAVLSIPAVDDADVTYINGRLAGETYGYSLRRLYHIPEGVLRQGENLIAVKVFDRVSDGGIWGDAENFYIEAGGERICLAGEWEYRPSATTAMYDATLDATHPNNFASLLYNGMIQPSHGLRHKGSHLVPGGRTMCLEHRNTGSFSRQ